MPKKAYTYLYLFKKWIFGNFKTLTDRQTDGRMEGLTDGWTVRWIDSSFWMKGSTKNKKKTNKITLKVCFPLHGLSCHAYPRSTLLGPNRGPWNQKNALDLLKNSHPTLFTLITNRKNKKKANLIFVLLYHWASPYVCLPVRLVLLFYCSLVRLYACPLFLSFWTVNTNSSFDYEDIC